MNDLLNMIFGGETATTEKKNTIAELLKVSPEALAAFEKAYKNATQEGSEAPGAFFEVSAKQAKTQRRIENAEATAEDLATRIAGDLLACYDLSTGYFVQNPQRTVILPKDIQSVPKEYRPQLTATAYFKHLSGPDSYIAVLGMLINSMEAKNAKAATDYYHMFRQGLDILDLDPILYEVLGMNRNSIGYWFPSLKKGAEMHGFFKIPETTIVKVPLPILQMSRLTYQELSETTIRIIDLWAMEAFHLDVNKTYFVKTGTFSSKFDFRNAKVTGEKEVRELGEYLLYIQSQACEMAGPLTTPSIYGVSTTNEWCVREYIEDKEDNPCIYKGMPLHTEYRFFVDFDTDEILGVSPYWEPDMMKKRFSTGSDANSPHSEHDYIIFKMHEDVLMKRYYDNVETVARYVKEMLPDVELTGQWSLDIMQNGDEFWLIDMATADTSALRGCVPAGKLKKQPENWIPRLPADKYTDDPE